MRRRKDRAHHPKRWISVIVIMVIFLYILLNRHGLFRLYQLRAEQERLEVEIALLQERATQLRQEMSSLQNDLVYIERLAREKYRMVKRGEKVFRVMQNSRPPIRNEGAEDPR
ncbi:MAG: septum formation initiator family protein [Candidatus Neomarinimicrobiota bacterium]